MNIGPIEHVAPEDAAALQRAMQDADMSHPEPDEQQLSAISHLVYATMPPRPLVVEAGAENGIELQRTQDAVQYVQTLLAMGFFSLLLIVPVPRAAQILDFNLLHQAKS